MADRWGKVETVRDFIFLGSKITVAGDYSHEIKKCFLLGSKAIVNLDSISATNYALGEINQALVSS